MEGKTDRRTPNAMEGSHDAKGMRFALVVSRFNTPITERLRAGAWDTLEKHGADIERSVVAWCPGAVEIPLVARKLAGAGAYDAVICLGAVIRGATPHFDLVCKAAASGVSRVTLETGIPVIFGVITTDTVDQALERSGVKGRNKGADAAVAAIEMVSLLRQIGT